MSAVTVTCGTPGCKEAPGHGKTRRFCAGHAETLAGIRDRISEEIQDRGAWYRRRGQKGNKNLSSTCCNAYCLNPRDPGRAYCDQCVDAGMVVEAG